MQLHETNWLSELWSTKDIYFKGTETGEFRLNEPYLRSTFEGAHTSESHDHHEDEWAPYMACCNRMLFKLGISLIEVYNWEPFELLEKNLRRSRADAITTIVQELYDDAGFNYGHVVKRCLRGLEAKETNLQHEAFKKEAYEKIVAPLEDVLKQSCDQEELFVIFHAP